MGNLPTLMEYLATKGLVYIDHAITIDMENSLLFWVYEQPWDTSLNRRTQHYGSRYVYKNGTGDPQYKVEEGVIPPILLELFNNTVQPYLPSPVPSHTLQIIINEYTPGQGIGKHCDSTREFGNWVASLSLREFCNVHFQEIGGDYMEKCVLISPRSLYIMTDDIRYKWTHQIPANNYYINGKGNKELRKCPRVSITFRAKK